MKEQRSFKAYKTLLNFSGGVDSLYCLWDYARRGEPLLIHYCQLINFTKRDVFEIEAVRKTLEWIDKKCPFNYYLVRTSFDYGNAQIVQDKEIIGFNNGIILRDNRFDIDNIIISSGADDMKEVEYYISSEADRIRLIEGVGRRRVKYIYPIKEKTKRQICLELPFDLFRLSWSCRTPVVLGNTGNPCGKCIPCRTVQPIMRERERQNRQYDIFDSSNGMDGIPIIQKRKRKRKTA